MKLSKEEKRQLFKDAHKEALEMKKNGVAIGIFSKSSSYRLLFNCVLMTMYYDKINQKVENDIQWLNIRNLPKKSIFWQYIKI